MFHRKMKIFQRRADCQPAQKFNLVHFSPVAVAAGATMVHSVCPAHCTLCEEHNKVSKLQRVADKVQSAVGFTI